MTGRRVLCGSIETVFCPDARVIGRHGVGHTCPGHNVSDCHMGAIVKITDKVDAWPLQYGCSAHVDKLAAGLAEPRIEPLQLGTLDPMGDVVARHAATHPPRAGRREDGCALCAHYARDWPALWVEAARARSLDKRAHAQTGSSR